MSYNDNYQTGYKNPPKANQFKKGVSGNPKGRPKKVKPEEMPFEEVLEQKLNEVIEIKQGNKIISMSQKEALAQVMITSGLKGNNSVIKSIFLFLEKLSKIKENIPPQVPVMVINPPKEGLSPPPPIYWGEDGEDEER